MPSKHENTYTIILIAILVLGFGLRIYGIDFGLPHSYHDDEDRLVHHALAFGMGDLNPHYFNYPSFMMYFLFLFYGAFYVFGTIFGYFSSMSDFTMLFFSDPTMFYIIGRAITALLGTATIFVVYLIGKRLYSRTAGVVAALTLSVLPVHVLSSHYITTDVPMTFFIIAAAYFSVRILEEGRLKHYILAAIMTGLAAGTKYNGVLASVFILTAHMARVSGIRAKAGCLFSNRIMIAGAVVVVIFFCVSPFCFLDFNTFIEDFRFDSEHIHNGVYGLSSGVHWIDYIGMFFTDELYSWPHRVANTAGPLLLLGVAYAIYRRGRKEAVIGIFPLLFFALIGSWSVVNRKYLLPVLPLCAIFAGVMIAEISGKVGCSKYRRWAAWACLAVLLMIPLRNSFLSDYVMSQEDTRTIAKRWIETNVPEGSKIALEWDTNVTVPLDESRKSIEMKISEYEDGKRETVHFEKDQMVRIHKMRLKAKPDREYEIVRIGKVEGIEIVPHLYDISELRDLEVEYIVVSSIIAETFNTKIGKEKYSIQARFYRDLDNKAVLVKTFAPETGKTPGPILRLYSLKPGTELSSKKVN